MIKLWNQDLIKCEFTGTGRPRNDKDERATAKSCACTTLNRTRANLCIAQLPEQFRTAIVLRELQGLQYEEIAEILGCALGTVKSRIWRARDRLQELLEPYLKEQGYDDDLFERKVA